MANKTSPFAALTSEQKQIKWMEYQSIRLPYTDTVSDASEAEQSSVTDVKNPAEAMPVSAAHTNANHPTVLPPREVYVQSPKTASVGTPHASQQKSRHHQYDAVIARMKQAELLAGSYYHCQGPDRR